MTILTQHGGLYHRGTTVEREALSTRPGSVCRDTDLSEWLIWDGAAWEAFGTLPAYARGSIVRGGTSAWEAYSAETSGAILIGDGTDVISTTNPVFTGTITLPNAGLHLLDTGGDHDLIISPGTDLTTDRTLTLVTGDADRTITLSGNPTLADWFDQGVKSGASPTFDGTNFTGIPDGALDVSYLQAGGSVALAGPWSMGSQAVTNVNLDTGTIDTAVTHTDWDAAVTHISADGSSHGYIDQDLQQAASPTFAGLTVVNAIDEFSIDGTLVGDSDDAVPTEKAVKTYVDGAAGGLPNVAGAGYALVSDGVNSWAVDQTPIWTGAHTGTDFLVDDGGTYGIAGNELLTFNTAGTVMLSGCNFFGIYSTEVGKTDWRFTISVQDADMTLMYNYDVGEAAFQPMNFGGTNVATDGVTVLANGFVGIGAAPASLLDVSGLSTDELRLVAPSGGTGSPKLHFRDNADGLDATIGLNADQYLTISVEDLANAVVISRGGDVGIGTGGGGIARLNVEQVNGAAAEVLWLKQGDVNEPLIFISATADAGSADRTLVWNSDFGVSGSLMGWLMVETKDAGARLPDAKYWVPLYAIPT